MYGKKTIAIICLFLLICLLAGCDKSSHPGVNNTQGGNTDWFLKHAGFENASIEQIQVTADGKVLVSSAGRLYLNQGGGYTEVSPPDRVSIFYVMEGGNTQTLIAGCSTGILYMKDIMDKDWKKTGFKAYDQPVNTIAGDSGNGYIYVGQASKLGGGLWRSRDNGKTWEKITNTTARGVVLHPENSDILYTVDRATYLSTDRGITWNKINTAANYGVLIHPFSPETAYIAFSQGVVVAGHNGKITDTHHFGLPGAMTCLEINFARIGEWAVGIWDYPSGIGGLYYSFDSGKSWVQIEDELVNERVTDMRFDKEGDRLYIGTAGKGLWVLNLKKIRNEK